MNLIKKVEEVSKYSEENCRAYGEVFTPIKLIQEMLDTVPQASWSDPTKTFFDPVTGNGNFEAVVVTRLMEGLKDVIPDEAARYQNIMEKQIYMAELQRRLARNIENIFNPDGKLKLNLYVGDALQIPKDYWNLNYEERKNRYPQHNVWDETPLDKMVHGKPFVKQS